MDSARSAYWFLPDAERRELASWRLAAALAQRLPVTGVLELHEGGGMYDMLHLQLSQDGSGDRAVKINRAPAGSVRLFGALRDPAQQSLDRLSRITAGPQSWTSPLADVAEVVREAEEIAEAYDSPGPGATDSGPTLTFMADLLEHAVRRDARQRWAWRSGTSDSSGTGLCWRDEYFGAVLATAGIRRGQVDASEQRWWFLTRADQPVLAVDVRDKVLFVGNTSLRGLAAAAMTKAMTAVREVAPKGGATLPAVIDGQLHQTLPQARTAYRAIARRLAEQLAGEPVTPFDPGSRITSYAHWFTAGPDRLILVMGPHESPSSAVPLLAYGLAWQSRRQLDLVLPAGFADAVLRVLPWLRSPVRVHLATEPGLEELQPPAHHEVLAATAALPDRSTTPHDLGALQLWLEPLLEEVASHDLTEQRRPSYCAWKFRGRQVLKAARGEAGTLHMTAGTDYTKPTTAKPAAYKVKGLTGPLSRIQVTEARQAIDRSIADRLAGADAGDLEHQLQADLDQHGLRGLDTTYHHREYPAWRSAGRDGFIDFLGVTPDGALDVVETKVGADAVVALQALEYFIWATANADRIRQRPGWLDSPRSDAHRITLVLGADKHGRCYDRYLHGVLEAFALDVPWRIFTVALTATTEKPQAPVLMPLSPVQLLAGERGQPPCAPPRWPDDTVHNDNDLFALLGVDRESDAADTLFRELDGAVQLGGGAGVTVAIGFEFETLLYPFPLSQLTQVARDLEIEEDRRQAAEE